MWQNSCSTFRCHDVAMRCSPSATRLRLVCRIQSTVAWLPSSPSSNRFISPDTDTSELLIRIKKRSSAPKHAINACLISVSNSLKRGSNIGTHYLPQLTAYRPEFIVSNCVACIESHKMNQYWHRKPLNNAHGTLSLNWAQLVGKNKRGRSRPSSDHDWLALGRRVLSLLMPSRISGHLADGYDRSDYSSILARK